MGKLLMSVFLRQIASDLQHNVSIAKKVVIRCDQLLAVLGGLNFFG